MDMEYGSDDDDNDEEDDCVCVEDWVWSCSTSYKKRFALFGLVST